MSAMSQSMAKAAGEEERNAQAVSMAMNGNGWHQCGAAWRAEIQWPAMAAVIEPAILSASMKAAMLANRS